MTTPNPYGNANTDPQVGATSAARAYNSFASLAPGISINGTPIQPNASPSNFLPGATAPWGGGIPGYTPGGGTPQSSSLTGQVGGYTGGMIPVYNPNDQAITGNPTEGAGSTYGLNNVWASIQNALTSNRPQNYATQSAQLGAAPQFSAAQGAAATGNAAQGYASLGTAADWQTALMQAAQGIGAQGRATYARPAQMFGSTGTGYALSPYTHVGIAGDLSWQGQQQALANTLANQAAGGGMSPADLQLQAGEEQSVANQLAVLGSQRGGMGNAALTARSAADQAAAAQANTNFQAAQLRANETIQAQQALGGVLGTARGQAQAYNENQAQLNQQTSLANAANIQAAMSQGAGFQQQTAMTNAANAQQVSLANQAAANATTGMNVGNAQQIEMANLQAQMESAQQNQAALNAANQGNAQLSQGMTLADLQALNAMASQNLTAQNQFGLNNVNNAQAMNLANLANQQQSNLANQSILGQYGLQQGQFNQQAALANQQAGITSSEDYYKQMMGLLGMQTGVAQNNQQAALADQQMRENAAMTQYGVDSRVAINNADAGANLMGAGIGAGASILGAIIAMSDQSVKTGVEGGNPMVQSFMEQYNEWHTGQSMQDRGLQEFDQLGAARQQGGGVAGGIGAAASALAGGIGSLAAKNKAASVAESKTLGMGSGAAAYAAGNMAGPPQDAAELGQSSGQSAYDAGQFAGSDLQSLDFGANAGGGGDEIPAAANEDEINAGVTNAIAQSDDQEKENVISGNRGMQQFLQQQNAQQQAQASMGAQNNSFMQTGQVPNSVADRQMPDADAGYGVDGTQNQPVQVGGFGGGYGNTMGGIIGGGMTSPGGFSQLAGLMEYGGFNPAAIEGYGGVLRGPSYSTNEPDILSNGGWMNSGQYDQYGMPTSGTVTLPNFMNSLTVNSTNDPYANTTIPTFHGVVNNPSQSYSTGSTAAANSGTGSNTPATNSSLAPVNPARAGRTNAPPMPDSVASQGGVGSSSPSVNPSITAVGGYAPLNPFRTNLSNLTTAASSSGTGYNTPALNASLRAISDEDQKEHVEPSASATKDMLDQLQAYSYRYKDPTAPGAAPGRRLGVMAQDLERSPLGAQFVRDTPNGKMVDYGQAAGTMMAALAYHNQRLDDQENMLRQLTGDR